MISASISHLGLLYTKVCFTAVALSSSISVIDVAERTDQLTGVARLHEYSEISQDLLLGSLGCTRLLCTFWNCCTWIIEQPSSAVSDARHVHVAYRFQRVNNPITRQKLDKD